jgi:hypothetical protein
MSEEILTEQDVDKAFKFLNPADLPSKEVAESEVAAAKDAELKEDWAKGWKMTDLVSSSPVMKELLAEAELDSRLDAAIDKVLADPEIDALLDEVAEGAAEELTESLVEAEPSGLGDAVAELRAEFDEFKAQVMKAFKHAGFKF